MKRQKWNWLVPTFIISVFLIGISVYGNKSVSLSSDEAIEPIIETLNAVTNEETAIVENVNIPNTEQNKNIISNSKSKDIICLASPTLGVIGISSETTSDNPSDNLFTVEIPELRNTETSAILSYEINGVKGSYGVSKSINDRLAYGGYVISQSSKWIKVSEPIDVNWLVNGKNRILFTSQDSFSYSVRNIQIVFNDKKQKQITLSSVVKAKNGVYIHGFVENGVSDLSINGYSVEINDNEFETIIDSDQNILNITATNIGGNKISHKTTITESIDILANNINNVRFVTNKSFAKSNKDSITHANTSISVYAENISKNLDLSITSLQNRDIPPLNYGMSNVTADDAGYRFLPHGTHFDNDGAIVSLKYDRTKIPSGYTEDDIRTFYFDNDSRKWIALDRIDIDKKNMCVVSQTTHFTDMINGVIQAPESPETEGFTPTMMNDIKIANPATGLNIISPPTANNRGSANLSFPIETPPARNGMAPNLVISYNSDVTNGLLGEGWDLNIPTISVDTRWGVPRYNNTKETETYLLNGAMLCASKNGNLVLAHRTDFNTTDFNRVSDRQFYTRIGGDFSRIIRKGDSPSSYTWEVTDKRGIKYTYGGDGAVLKGVFTDVNGNSKEVIAEWKLSRIEETHGDYITFSYDTVNENAIGGLTAKAIYLKEVKAYHNGANSGNPHTIITLTRGITKNVKTNNARYGFLTSSNSLLENISVNFLNEPLRSYSFEYETGVFDRTLLSQIKQFDCENNLVSYHKFNYFDDVTDSGKMIPYHSQTSYNISSDNIGVGLQKIGTKYASLLGSSESSTSGNSFYAGIGGFDGSPTKSTTGGLSVGYSENTTEGRVSLLDLNGDGLPDKVYKSNGNVYFRAQSVTDTNTIFEQPIEIPTLNHISKSFSSTTSTGLKGNVGWGPIVATAGADYSSTKTETNGYFSDVNGDGLPDYVSEGRVYFNRLIDNIPTFSTDISNTSNPITYSGIVSPDSIFSSAELLAEQDSLMRKSPMLDAVRLWVAPKSGNVVIEGNVQLIQPNDVNAIGYDKRDGVRVAVQIESSEKWSKNITKDDLSSFKHSIAAYVSKGDKVFFRVQSGTDPLSNGYFDNVKWSPTIKYCIIEEDNEQADNSYPVQSYTISPNKDYIDIYNSAESNVYSSDSYIRLSGECNSFKLNGTFTKPRYITDNITLKIIGVSDDNSNTQEQVLWSEFIEFTDTRTTFNFSRTINNENRFQNLKCEVSSNSNIRWQDIKWKPNIIYTYFTDSINTANDTILAPVKYNVFANQIQEGNPVKLANYAACSPQYNMRSGYDGESYNPFVAIFVKPQLVLNSDYNGSVTLKVKSVDELYISESYNIVNGVLQNHHLEDKYINSPAYGYVSYMLPYAAIPDTIDVWCEFYFDSNVSIRSATFNAFIGYRSDSTQVVSDLPTYGYGTASVFAKSDDNRFGTLYRGWGAFLYNSGNYRYNKPIEIDLMGYDYHSEVYQQNKMDYPNEDTPYYLDISESVMYSLNVDSETLNKWVGSNKSIFITDSILSASRLIKDDVKVNNPLSYLTQEATTYSRNQIFPGYTLVSKNSGMNVMGGLTQFSRSDAETSGTIELTTMDLNGDNYPDIVSKNNINYTTTLGGISSEKLNWNERLKSKATSVSYGSGGNPIAAYTSSVNAIQSIKGNTETNKSNANSKGYNIAPSLDFSKSTNTDISLSSYEDVNGDGLLDMVIEDNGVLYGRINYGYGFSDRFSLTNGMISKSVSSSQNIGAGLGFDIGAGSISGGIGAATTETSSSQKLMDINGDGLVDILYIENGKLMVCLNNGIGYNTTPIEWANINTLDNSESTSTSLNVAVSAYVPLPFFGTKLIFTPGTSFGKGISNIISEIRDFNGDGFPDLIESDSESSLKIRKSTIARSNKLKSVVNSLGGKFYLDYEHTGASSDFPGGKWVMSSLVIDDGISDDGSMMMNSFEYANGRKDRYEREFLGFGKVTTNNLDTDNDNAIYRKVVQVFNTSNYYAQGNILSSYVSDASDNIYNKETNEYYSYGVTASGNQYNFETFSDSHNSAYTPLKYNKKESFEGGNSGIIMSESWYGYNVTGSGDKFGELATFKYSDKGNLGNNGSGTYDYQTTIGYHNITSDGKYILGLPNLVTVNSNDNSLLRKSSASYNDNGEILSLTQHLNNGSAVTNFEYDGHGNITKRTLPANNKGQRMYYSYLYETSQNMYVTSITDAYGYNSTLTNYDYRYGIPLKHIDINSRETTYTIDDLGRITSVLSPIDKHDVEIDGYSRYTIKFEYANAQINDNGEISQPAKALTYHFNNFTDDTEDNYIMTVAYCDGFGRNIQVQKEAIVGNVSGQSTHAMIVSGRTKYDAFGRVIESYYPTTVNYNGNFNFISTFDNITPTISVYDILDRTTQNILPDNTITSYDYNIDTSTQSIVTTITDANDNISKTYTNGSGKTVKTEQFENSNTAIPTTFEYDGIGQLVKVTDAEGNITSSTYDMGGRVTQVIHPASGTTSYNYDNLGNVTSKQTSNMTTGNTINYNYDFTRLSSVEYPNNPENNILLLYGSNNENNCKGRVIIKTDGSGATEYKYDKLGNITYERRSVVVPNNGIYTFVTQYSYDSFNRLRDMTYPDGEIVTYNYDAGGNVCSVTHNNGAGESDYVDKILYDKFNNRTYMKYGNGIVSTYSYDPLRCRLSNMTAGNFINKSYEYDAVSNVLSIINDASNNRNMSHSYSYDNLYRLISANGVYSDTDNKTASYNLTMGYDNMHRITSKQQFLTQENVQFDGTLYAGYNMSYTYDDNKKFQLSSVSDNNYRSESNPVDSVYNTHTYQYDANGNLTYVATGRKMKDGHTEDLISERKLLWDDENRLMAISDNGYVSTYRYDDAGNRTVKLSGYGEAVFVNASDVGNVSTQTNRFTAYPNPYMVYNGSRYYKHIYVGAERIVSKVSVNNPDYDPRQEACAGNSLTGYTVKLQSQQQALSDSVASIYAKFEVPYYPNNNDDYGYNWSDGVRRSVANPDSYGELAYFYHSDHLGSTLYVTTGDGGEYQQVEYTPFGEIFVESDSLSWDNPYLFNGKELDEETGLYYYGARYYDPRTSLWLSTDPMELKYPNVSTYAYCANNPINIVDLKGDTITVISKNNNFLFSLNDGTNTNTNLTAKSLYSKGIQWFAPSADNYMELISINPIIKELNAIKHFSWDEIVQFGEIDRDMFSYRTGGDGDWKADGKPGDGYLLVTVGGFPYWADAIGQIPFALNNYRNNLKAFANYNTAAKETIRIGMKFGNGNILSSIFGSSDNSNSYDNEMIRRAVQWSSKRYKIIGRNPWNRNAIISTTNYPPMMLKEALK